MDTQQITSIIGQLGASGIFAIATVAIAKAFYQHYEDEIKYLRGKVDSLDAQLRELRASIKS